MTTLSSDPQAQAVMQQVLDVLATDPSANPFTVADTGESTFAVIENIINSKVLLVLRGKLYLSLPNSFFIQLYILSGLLAL
jgi:hypothetical protein